MVDETGGKSPFTVLHFLLGVNFPASREQLVEHARKRSASGDIIGLLQQLPNRRYRGMADVEEAVKQMED